ncbi:MAG TPA: hypothetical protein VEL11_11610 [Candidatus Bathyarchaeia archaeon]|nr:hypothetical protein [Candidatus Bathyarchaeia archaeon]
MIITGAILIGCFSTITFSEGKTETTTTQQQHQFKAEGNTTTTTSNSIALTPHLHNNSTSKSTYVKRENNNEVAISGGNLSATWTRSLSTSNNYNYDNNAKQLSISIQSSQNIVNGRGTSTVTAIAYDATTDKKIDNAVVKLKITFTSNDTSKEIVGHNGEVTYSAEIKPNSKDNSNIGFMTTVQAFAPGYISTSKTSSYSSSSSTLIMTDNSHHESIINNHASSNLTQNILKNVQNKLEQNGIDFSLEN